MQVSDLDELEIPAPPAPEAMITALDMQHGMPVSVLDRLTIMSSDDWEVFTLEITHYLKGKYKQVVRCGGGGDMGRDIIAYTESGWDNYQCKRYKDKLSVADVVLEIGKIAYYSYIGKYSIPGRYYFVSPKGCSTDLLKVIADPDELKRELLERWETTCAKKITTSKLIELDDDFLRHIDTTDFSIFDHIPPLQLIDMHKDTPFHGYRFGTYDKRRPVIPKAPDAIDATERVYTQALFDAFTEHKSAVVDSSNIHQHPELADELRSARNNYYAAESLERFSRDWIPDDYCFGDLKEECHEAIRATVSQQHSDGFARYLKTCEISAMVDYRSHPLSPFMKIQDKKGLCHHIVNERKFQWVRK